LLAEPALKVENQRFFTTSKIVKDRKKYYTQCRVKGGGEAKGTAALGEDFLRAAKLFNGKKNLKFSNVF